MNHEFIVCQNPKPCGCLECSGTRYCKVCGCIDDELLQHCPGYLLNEDACNSITSGKVTNLFLSAETKAFLMTGMMFRNSGISEM